MFIIIPQITPDGFCIKCNPHSKCPKKASILSPACCLCPVPVPGHHSVLSPGHHSVLSPSRDITASCPRDITASCCLYLQSHSRATYSLFLMTNVLIVQSYRYSILVLKYSSSSSSTSLPYISGRQRQLLSEPLFKAK